MAGGIARLSAAVTGTACVLAGCAGSGSGSGTSAGTDRTDETTAATQPADLGLFAYDDAAPVRVTVQRTRRTGPVRIRDVRYPSPSGTPAVTATLSQPRTGGSEAGVLLLHGMPLDRRDMEVPGVVYACAGASALAIDAPYVRTGEGAIKLDERDRAEQVQFIIDLRRGIDLLAQDGATRVAVVGLSYGASMGALLAGVDRRVSSAALLVGDGGLVAHLTDEAGQPLPPLSTRPEEEREAWLAAMRPVEPLLFVGGSDADLLFLNGRSDTLVAASDAEDLHAAAGPQAEVRWYDTGHDLTPEAFRYHFEWVGERLGLDPARLARCIDAHAGLP